VIARQREDVGCRQHGVHIPSVSQAAQACAQAGGVQHRGNVLAAVGRQPLADNPKHRVGNVAHRGGQLGIALVAHQAGDGHDHHGIVGHAQFGTDARAGRRIGAKDRRVAPVADHHRVAPDVPAARIGRVRRRDGGEHVGEARANQLHRQPGAAPQRAAGLIVQKAVAGVGDARHPGDARGRTAEEATDRHVRMHQIGLFGAQQADQGAERPQIGGGGDAALERHRLDPEAVGADLVQQRAVGADADHLVTAGAGAAHRRQQEMPQRKVDVGDFDDFHGRG
jgi:hypothetical protein